MIFSPKTKSVIKKKFADDFKPRTIIKAMDTDKEILDIVRRYKLKSSDDWRKILQARTYVPKG